MISRWMHKPEKYFNWWVTTLKSCLPAQATSLFKKYNKEVELILRHQGDGVFLQDASGRILDSISNESPARKQDKEATDLDFYISADEEVDQTILQDVDATHIELSGHNRGVVHEFKRKDSDPTTPTTTGYDLDDIDLTVREESTVVFNKEDKTTRLLGLVSEDDTLVISDDQGTLLNVGKDNTGERDSTVLYYSDRGKIRVVEAKTEAKPEQQLDIHLVVDGAVREKKQDDCDEFILAASLLQKQGGNKKCLYLLPDDKVFSLVLNYPVEALENIENVLRYDLEKHIPLNFQEIRFFYALNIISAQSKVDVEVIVIKSAVYDILYSAFESEDEREIICTTKHFYQNYGTKINILASRKGDLQGSKLNLGNLHTALNLALLVLLLAMPYYLQYQKLNAVQPKTSAEIARAGKIVSTINQLNAEIKLGEKLGEQISKDHRMLDLLAQLSEHIATDAWISRFTYKNGELKLKGEAVSATTVSDDLNNTGLFESIKFISSIVKNPNTKKEAFELSLKVKTDA